jgi:threonine dehydrogenase-like Zn-dependent dehydrogenase
VRPPGRIIKYRFTTGELVAEERDLAQLAADEVLVEIAGVALSGDPDSEVAGRVVATGEAAAEWIDRRVLVPRLLTCGECSPCRRGRPASCAARRPRAGLASHERVPVRFLCHLAPPLWSEGADLALYAGLADTLSAPYAALARVGVQPNELWLVSGAGPSGLAAIAFLRARGAKVAVLAARPSQRRRAQALGAHALSMMDCDPNSRGSCPIKEWAQIEGVEPFVYRLIATGEESSARAHVLQLLSPGAIALFLDGWTAPIPLTWEELIARELTLSGAGPCHPDLLPEVCAWVARGELSLVDLVEPVGIAQAAEARTTYLRGESERLPILRF